MFLCVMVVVVYVSVCDGCGCGCVGSSRPVAGGLLQLPLPIQWERDDPWPAGQGQLPGDHGRHAHHELLPRGDRL